MRQSIACFAVAALLAVGCDRTVSERQTTKRHSDGTVTKTTESVKEHPDGTVSVEKHRDVDR